MKEHEEVLLVEDSALVRDHFGAVLPGADLRTTTQQVLSAIKAGRRWKTAFVDLDLPGSTMSALGIMTELRKLETPPRVICYTTLSEAGRLLLTMAAYHWLGVTMVMNKAAVRGAQLRNVVAGEDPTTPQWSQKLSRHSHLIDTLFQDYYWASCWQQWPGIHGSTTVAEKVLRISRHQADTFQVKASDAVMAMYEQPGLFSTRNNPIDVHRKRNVPRAVTLVAFARENTNFFQLPDLPTIAAQHTRSKW